MSANLLPAESPIIQDGGVAPDDLWHIAATDAEDERAEAGLPWRTLCGQRRPVCRDSRDSSIAEPDDCVVCFSIYDAEWDE